MSLLADASQSATPYLIALVGSGGLLGALLGFFKLRGDRDSQAVVMQQGAMETMQELNQALKDDLDRAHTRADFYKTRCDELAAELEQVHRRWGPFPVDETP